ncbi:hypothetical protein APASM_4697 [Actinosynnema pretiosum subsp. pretiosum]|nr:hypothetical protein APASM_4697 [Actinosynnema pretiosum subsp. pretiosum]
MNEAYQESTGTVNQLSEALCILGGDADVDRFIQQTRSNVNDQRATQTKLKVKAMSFKFNDHFFNGDISVQPKGFDGLKKRLLGTQVIDAGPNGLPIVGNGGNDIHDFFDQLDALIASVDGEVDALYMNKAIRARIMSAGRRAGGTDWVNQLFNTGGSEPLRKDMVPTYNGIPMLNPGKNLLKEDILPMTETVGTSTDTGSIYAVRFGEDEVDQAVTALTNGRVMVDDLGELQEKPAMRTRVELYGGLAVFGGKAAARLRGVRAR